MIKLKFPTKYIAFTQYFGNKHKAVDIANAVTVGNKKYDNKDVYMVADGIITQNGYASDYGYFVEYKVVDDEGNTFIIADGHFDKKSSLKVGEKYPMGTFINKMGNKGTSLGVHDHHRLNVNGNRVNPLNYEYVYPDQVVGTKETAKLMYYTPEPTPVEPKVDDTKVKELETLVAAQKKTIQELNDKINLQTKEIESKTNQVSELETSVEKLQQELTDTESCKASFNIDKDGYYKVKCLSGELLIIK